MEDNLNIGIEDLLQRELLINKNIRCNKKNEKDLVNEKKK